MHTVLSMMLKSTLKCKIITNVTIVYWPPNIHISIILILILSVNYTHSSAIQYDDNKKSFQCLCSHYMMECNIDCLCTLVPQDVVGLTFINTLTIYIYIHIHTYTYIYIHIHTFIQIYIYILQGSDAYNVLIVITREIPCGQRNAITHLYPFL